MFQEIRGKDGHNGKQIGNPSREMETTCIFKTTDWKLYFINIKKKEEEEEILKLASM